MHRHNNAADIQACLKPPITPNKAAFFDFDGTLSREVSPKFISYLSDAGFFSRKFSEDMENAMDEYSRNLIPHSRVNEIYLETLSEGLRGKRANVLAAHARMFSRQNIEAVYLSSSGLIRLVRDGDFHPLVVSAGLLEVVRSLARSIGVQEVHATTMETIDGIYTGKVKRNFLLRGSKGDFVSSQSSRFMLNQSLAFGDSTSDLEMLRAVGRPLALNASGELKEIAKKEGWPSLDSHDVLVELGKLLRG